MAHKCDGCRYKGEHQEMMFRPFGVCKKETNLIEAEKAYNADKCPYKKTNADRIRAMSDEELANVIALLIEKDECFREDFADCKKCPLYSFCSGCKPGTELEWLKKFAEE